MDSELRADEEESLKRTLIYKLRKIEQQHQAGEKQTPVKSSSEKMTKKPQHLPRTSPGMSTRQFLRLLELERQEEVQSRLNARLNVFKEFRRVQEERNKQASVTAQRAAVENANLQVKQLLEAACKAQSPTLLEMVRLREVALKQMQDRQNILRTMNKRLIAEEVLKKISVNILKSYYDEVKSIVTLCSSLDENGKPLSSLVPMNSQALNELNSEVQKFVERCSSDSDSLTEQDIVTSEELLSRAVELHTAYKRQVEEVKKRQKAEQKEIPTPKVVEEKVPELPQLSKYISMANLERYEGVFTFAQKFKQYFRQLETDPAMKQFRFECKKAVNVPVNALSDVNAQHILDKYQKLHGLLAGQPVQTSNKQNISAATHPQGVAFCMDLLAKKFVLQGDTMVSSNPESAFPYASVMLSLWNDFPDFGHLLLAYFYQFCPYLIPMKIPRQAAQTEKDYYKQLGYQYSADGQVEKQDKFLKRMTGIMRLYFTLTIAQPKSSQPSSPYDLKNSWRWLSSMLKLEPELDITATALCVFLETVGFRMKAVYGVIFDKIMQIIVQVFLPKCHQASCTGGALTRLELLVTDYMQKNSFQAPHGYNETSFW